MALRPSIGGNGLIGFLDGLLGSYFSFPLRSSFCAAAFRGRSYRGSRRFSFWGSAQGAVGWFMVKSGLADRVDVKSIPACGSSRACRRHCGLCLLARSLCRGAGEGTEKKLCREFPSAGQTRAGILAGFVYLQIIAGAFVAGLKAGHASNTWPLMNGEIVPPGLDALSPLYLNLFENPLTAQFVHRALAYAIAIFAAAFAVFIWNAQRPRALRHPMLAITAAVLIQIALGVATIVYGVPLAIALAHQANAILVFALSLWALHRAIRPEQPVSVFRIDSPSHRFRLKAG